MKLHENTQLFVDAVNFASRPMAEGGLGVSALMIEKDYWICRSLKLMAERDTEHRAIFKGGTSLSKAYGIGSRFSEDIDVAISEVWTMSGNQLKTLIKRTSKSMTAGLEEVEIPGKTSKGSRYHKAYYRYPQKVTSHTASSINPGLLLVEINSFANPYPSERKTLSSFLTTFLQQNENGRSMLDEYDMQPFEVMVLDKRRTMTEKIVSLVRFSMAADFQLQLAGKVRHFYDLHFLVNDELCRQYLVSDVFLQDFASLLKHDQETFGDPQGWQTKHLSASPLFTDFGSVWDALKDTYLRELPSLAYQQIPDTATICQSMQVLIERLKSVCGVM